MNVDIALALMLAMVAGGAVSSCPQGWISDVLSTDRCFYYISNRAKFEDVLHACRHIGGEIAPAATVIDTASLAELLQRNIAEQERENVWLNMKYNESEDKWTSINGSAVNTEWHTGYPKVGWNCAVFLYSSIKMKNKLCTRKSAVACVGVKGKIELITRSCPAFPQAGTTENVPPGTFGYLSCEGGYKLSSSCHKKAFCQKDGTWSRTSAELAVCQARGCGPLVLGEAVQEISMGGEKVGVHRSFTCPPGSLFRWEGSSNITIVCRADGTWAKLEGTSINQIEDCIATTTTPTTSAATSATTSATITAAATITATTTTTTTTTATATTPMTSATTPMTSAATTTSPGNPISSATKPPMPLSLMILLVGLKALLRS